MKMNLKILYIVLVLFHSKCLFAQNSLEHKYANETIELNIENTKLDSLNNILQKRVSVIENEKNKANRNTNRITTLLASTASLTNKIDSLRKNIYHLSNKIDLTKKVLYNFYTSKIDSLNNISNSSKSANVEKIKLIEKRLLVSPKINVLSFSPQSVLNLEPSKDSIKQKIYNEYLNEASDEVEKKMIEIKGLKKEISNIIQLNEETKEFLEDINFDNNFAVYSNPNVTQSNLEYTSDFTDKAASVNDNSGLNTVNTQSKNFSDILFQFGLSETYNPAAYLNSNDNSAVTNLKDFNSLIETVEKQLKDYKVIISNKLKGS